jgi:hypothetical protein
MSRDRDQDDGVGCALMCRFCEIDRHDLCSEDDCHLDGDQDDQSGSGEAGGAP